MKNELLCDIVRDLLPVYADGISSTATKEAVEAHIKHCRECRDMKDGMFAEHESFEQFSRQANEEDKQLFKKIKRRMNKNMKIIIIVSCVSILTLFFGFQLLFNMPVKNVLIDDISVSATVYPLTDMERSENESFVISADEDDTSSVFSITIPELSDHEINMTEQAAGECEYITVISWSSPYFLRTIQNADKNDTESDTLYVSEFKTTFMNNKTDKYNSALVCIEMRKINRIVYVADSGDEITLWENSK